MTAPKQTEQEALRASLERVLFAARSATPEPLSPFVAEALALVALAAMGSDDERCQLCLVTGGHSKSGRYSTPCPLHQLAEAFQGHRPEAGPDKATSRSPYRNYWVRWFSAPSSTFETTWPWWHSGFTGDDRNVLVAAVRGAGVEQAKAQIVAAYEPFLEGKSVADVIEWSFVSERPDDWQPFTERFPRADWMEWPPSHGFKEKTLWMFPTCCSRWRMRASGARASTRCCGRSTTTS